MINTPIKMQRLNLWLMKMDAQVLASTLADLGVLHLQESTDDTSTLAEMPARDFHEVFHRIKSRYHKVIAFDNRATRPKSPVSRRVDQDVSLQQLQSTDESLRELWSKVSGLEEKIRQLKERASTVKQLTGSLQRFQDLQIDLSRLGRSSQFLNVQAGTIRSRNRNRLDNALSIIGYVMGVFYTAEGTDHILVVGSQQKGNELQELLKSADFRSISIPEEFSERPEQIEQRLSQQKIDIEHELEQCNSQIRQLIDQNSDFLSEVYQLLNRASPFASLAAYLRGKGDLVALQGWVPESRTDEVRETLEQNLRFPFHMVCRRPSADELDEVPTQLREHWWMKPFQLLVRQYGIPQYSEIDPGALFAFSYILMFGMMFGDVGHGAVIVIGALLLARKSSTIAIVGTLAGLSSTIFGFLYGSIFGYEHVLHPLWMSPMHDPQHVLLLSLYWGIGFLIIANLLAIRNMLAREEYHRALYSPQGAVGLVIYIGAVISMMQFFEHSVLPFWSLPLLSVLMAGILYYQWKHSEGSVAERVLMVFVEGLEFVISNVSATLSFLRVAAFTLNHIALSAAVFAIAAMLDTFGHWVAIFLGNVFVIVLEGAIVAIQCLRLEYYEGFSRFFSGKGRLYRPLKSDLL